MMGVRPLALGLVVGHCVTLLAVGSGFYEALGMNAGDYLLISDALKNRERTEG